MSEPFNLDDAIQSSLASFTKQIDEMSSDKFNEMRKCSFFDPIPGEWLTEIAKDARIVTFAPGKEIIHEGNAMNAFYVLLFGTASVFLNQKNVGAIRSGECVGESTFFPDKSMSRAATVIADSKVIAVEITGMAVNKFEGDLKTYMDKALLLALYKKLQFANLRIEQLSHTL